MAVFDHFGELSTAQDLSSGTVQTENIVDLAALGIQGYGPDADVFIDMECETAAAGDSADTFKYEWLVATTTNLDNGTQSVEYFKLPMTTEILGILDARQLVAGAKIHSGRIPDQVWQMAKEGFRYFGCQMTVSAGATVSVNVTVSTSRPRTPDNQQVTESDVGVPT